MASEAFFCMAESWYSSYKNDTKERNKFLVIRLWSYWGHLLLEDQQNKLDGTGNAIKHQDGRYELIKILNV